MTRVRYGGPQDPHPRRHALLVDGDVENRQRLYDALTAHGVRVSTAPSGEVALQLLTVERPEIVLMAESLGDISAENLLERIRACNDAIPVLLLCGNRTPEHAALINRVQACLPRALSATLVVAEVDLWLGAPAAAAPTCQSGTILLVDDEERLRNLVQEFLELNGFTVETAGSGEEALRKIERAAPRAVVLDIRMPGMDGVLALKKLRVAHPHLPVIIVTHADDEKTRDEAMALGVRCYLTKPLNFTSLKDALASTKSPTSSSTGSNSSG